MIERSLRPFSRLFRELRNQTAGAWLGERRLNGARRRLPLPDRLLKAMSTLTGYGDVVSFNRSFRQFHALPSGKFRQANLRPV